MPVCACVQERKAQLSRSLRYMTKATAMMSLLRRGTDADRLSLSTRPRSSSGFGLGDGEGTMVVPGANPVQPSATTTADSVWRIPPEASQDIRFQGMKGGVDVLTELHLMKGTDAHRPDGTMTQPRALPSLPAPSAAPGTRVTSKHLSSATVLHDSRKVSAITIGELKDKTKEAMETTNFALAASLSRLGMTKGSDPALSYV